MSAPIRYPFTGEGLSDALAALGTTETAVMTNLLAMGFQGYRDNCTACPVARYLLAVIDGIERVDVSGGQAQIARAVVEYDLVGEEHFTVYVPGPVYDFIDMFDAGVRPNLEAPDAAA